MLPDRSDITGLILAGGRARRMGGIDKGLIEFRGRPLVAHALAVMQSITGTVLISANRNLERYAAFGHPVIADPGDRFDGPLAGLLAGLSTARTAYVLMLPVDVPLMKTAVLARLVATLVERDAEVCAPSDGTRLQPVCLFLRQPVRSSLAAYLGAGGRKVEDWLARERLVVADCSDESAAFANVNAPEDLALLEARGGAIDSALPDEP